MPKKKPEQKGIRDGFGEALVQLGRNNPDVVALNADLTSSIRMAEFQERYPERFFQVGIAEQNMAGVAAGLALSGKIPFMGSFSSFQPMRNLDQIRSSISIMGANVKIISSHAGFSYAPDGVQIEAFEDIGVMRMLPGMIVLVPADSDQAYQLTINSADIDGPVYIRLGREKTRALSDRGLNIPEVRIGEAQHLIAGDDLVIFANGYMVNESLDAAEELKKAGYNVGVINIHSVKPLDKESILKVVSKTGKIISVEEHQKAGGLGSSIAELLADFGDPYVHKIMGVDDTFGETARTNVELLDKYGLTARHIVKEAVQLLE